MKSLFTVLAAAVALAGLCFCAPLQRLQEREHQKTNLHPRFSGLLKQCGSAQRLEIFEGLPHPVWEAELLKSEERRGDVFRNHDFGFYTPALHLSTAVRQELAAGVTSESSFEPWGGEKLCGGFHPDLLLRFHNAGGITDVHLCFGCGEAIFYGSDGPLRVDIKTETGDRWEAIADQIHRKRPAPRRGKAPAPSKPENAIDALLKDSGKH